MKGGLAVVASLLDRASCGTGWARVGVILYAGEEGPIEGNDLRRLLDGQAAWAAAADLAIVLEPTDVNVEVGCLGVVNLEAVFKGVACHSARPWLGTNAVSVAIPWLTQITRNTPRSCDRAYIPTARYDATAGRPATWFPGARPT
jgi:succinyl-diaminopimelate desuccinylase